MTANYSKSYLGYLNKLVNENNNSYHGSIGKKLIETDCSALTKEIVTNLTQDLRRTEDPRTKNPRKIQFPRRNQDLTKTCIARMTQHSKREKDPNRTQDPRKTQGPSMTQTVN